MLGYWQALASMRIFHNMAIDRSQRYGNIHFRHSVAPALLVSGSTAGPTRKGGRLYIYLGQCTRTSNGEAAIGDAGLARRPAVPPETGGS